MVVEVGLSVATPLYFATGGLEEAGGHDEHDLCDLRFVVFGDSLTDGLKNGCRVKAANGRAFDFLHDHQFFAFFAGDAKGGSAPWLYVWVAIGNGEFDVLRVEVAAPQDDEVFEPTRDKQLSLMQEAKVSCAEVAAVLLVMSSSDMK